MRHVVVRPDFYADAQSAADWYDGEHSGLGQEFLDELNSSISRLIAAPESFALVDRNIRVCQLHRFPYGIYFRERTAEILITGVLHLHRDDSAWKSRK
jgi:hypothetical protein